jgi:glutamine amidotransferase
MILKNKKDVDSGVKLGFTDYSTRFVSYIENKRIFGVQFHPEKSQKNGLNFLRNFINLDE